MNTDTETLVKVTWTTKFMGDFHAMVSAGDVEGFSSDLRRLGFEPVV